MLIMFNEYALAYSIHVDELTKTLKIINENYKVQGSILFYR